MRCPCSIPALRRSLLALAAAAAIVPLQGCSRQDAAKVAAFNEQYAATLEIHERAIAASYPYQLAETPESEAVGRVFARIRTRSASRADLEEALRAERERVWYIDHFESEITAFRAAIEELSWRAAAIGDSQIREAAAGVCRQFSATSDAAGGLLAAQRERSQQVVIFLTELISRERRFPPRAEMEATGAQLDQLRDRMRQTMREPQAAFATFQSLVDQELGPQH